MVYMIMGASHSGKTALAQALLEERRIPYLSIDHLKMGLIRSHNTSLTPISSDQDLTDYLWPIVREIIKTAIENGQNLIVEGCYIPFDYKKDFSDREQEHLRCYCLVLTREYIEAHFDRIKAFSCVIEQRLDDDLTREDVIEDNFYYQNGAERYSIPCIFITDEYRIDLDLIQ